MTAVYIIDDNANVRTATSQLVQAMGHSNHPFANGTDFLDALHYLKPGCLLVDLRLSDMSGIDVIRATASRRAQFPAILVTGHADIDNVVEAMKAGAQDVLQKPARPEQLRRVLAHAIDTLEANARPGLDDNIPALARQFQLTERQTAVLTRLVAGRVNKEIAVDLQISTRTVEMHRAAVMAKLGVHSLPALLRVLIAATVRPTPPRAEPLHALAA